jgi:hypothetical protein
MFQDSLFKHNKIDSAVYGLHIEWVLVQHVNHGRVNPPPFPIDLSVGHPVSPGDTLSVRVLLMAQHCSRILPQPLVMVPDWLYESGDYFLIQWPDVPHSLHLDEEYITRHGVHPGQKGLPTAPPSALTGDGGVGGETPGLKDQFPEIQRLHLSPGDHPQPHPVDL